MIYNETKFCDFRDFWVLARIWKNYTYTPRLFVQKKNLKELGRAKNQKGKETMGGRKRGRSGKKQRKDKEKGKQKTREKGKKEKIGRILRVRTLIGLKNKCD